MDPIPLLAAATALAGAGTELRFWLMDGGLVVELRWRRDDRLYAVSRVVHRDELERFEVFHARRMLDDLAASLQSGGMSPS